MHKFPGHPDSKTFELPNGSTLTAPMVPRSPHRSAFQLPWGAVPRQLPRCVQSAAEGGPERVRPCRGPCMVELLPL